MKYLKFKYRSIFYKILGCLAVLGILSFIARLYLKVKAGEGLDYYISGHGYKLNYIGALTFFAILPLALGGGWLLGKYLKWRDCRNDEKLLKERLAKKSKRKRRKT